MADANAFKLASDLIKRILDAADKGELYYLQQLRSVRRTGPSPKRQEASTQLNFMRSDAPQRAPSERIPARSELRPRTGASYSEEYLTSEFSRFDSKDELKSYLQERHSTKAAIVEIARALHVPAPKSDDYDAILDRIVEATLGYKLRSRAVRGAPSGRSSESDS